MATGSSTAFSSLSTQLPSWPKVSSSGPQSPEYHLGDFSPQQGAHEGLEHSSEREDTGTGNSKELKTEAQLVNPQACLVC